MAAKADTLSLHPVHPTGSEGEIGVGHAITEDDMSVVRRSMIFSSLNDETLTSLISDGAISSHARGEVLFMQGDQATAFFVVLEGWVKVYRMTAAGDEAIVGIFTRGQNFAEAAAFTGGIYPASGEAVSDARILKIPARRLFDRISKSPEIGLAMLASTSQHLHLLVRQIEQLKAHTGAQRVAEFLVSMTSQRSGRCKIALPYDKALLAGKLGMKPESLSRAFQRLKTVGVVIDRDEAIIGDIAGLADFMERERADIMKSRN